MFDRNLQFLQSFFSCVSDYARERFETNNYTPMTSINLTTTLRTQIVQ